jgi:hypothetical protein
MSISSYKTQNKMNHDLAALTNRLRELNTRHQGKTIVVANLHEREGQHCQFVRMHLHITEEEAWFTMEVKAHDGIILELPPKNVFLLQ